MVLARVRVQKRKEPPLPLGGGGSHRRKSSRLPEERPTARNEDEEGEEYDDYEDDGNDDAAPEEGRVQLRAHARIARRGRPTGRLERAGLGRELHHGADDDRYDAACQVRPASFPVRHESP
ncbi:MAG: hypothetical protein SangKO_092010 [Sandaracinaceae bacterium]